jgi:hypothetical protein
MLLLAIEGESSIAYLVKILTAYSSIGRADDCSLLLVYHQVPVSITGGRIS